MASMRQKFSVGLFVIVGVSLVIFFTLILGLSDYFKEGHRYVGYFEDSVRGLNPSARVRYRGVEVGLVEAINLAPDGNLVEVVMLIDKQLADVDGVVATIRGVGITGIMYIDLDRATPKDKQETPALTFTPAYPVIATRPSEMSRMIEGVDKIIANLQDLRINEISTGMETALDNFNRIADEARIGEVSASIRETLEKGNAILDVAKWEEIHASLLEASRAFTELAEQSRQTVARIDQMVEENREPLGKTLADAGEAVKKAEGFFDRAAAMTADADMRVEAFDQKLTVITDDLQQAIDNLNRLLDQVAANPSLLVFGRPVPPKPIDE